MRHVQKVHTYKGDNVMGEIIIDGKTDLIYSPICPCWWLKFSFYARQCSATCQFHNEEIYVLPWLAQSPDMNPIEHVWDILQRRITPHMGNIYVYNAVKLLTTEWHLLDHLIFLWTPNVHLGPTRSIFNNGMTQNVWFYPKRQN